ncbi:hypothetical protein KIV56_06285 [Cryobacterium breve]|uniref:Uncharacterized protein n=1 Tax=Cryobacterium breve TaxID=1259258 RepID=A0ABY7NG03_9MICO|nr:hypothetical protein [Cryobacterium breve]WBM80907.1 hypothetical protein KIV56_06285 [Cryobacterium breve]
MAPAPGEPADAARAGDPADAPEPAGDTANGDAAGCARLHAPPPPAPAAAIGSA